MVPSVLIIDDEKHTREGLQQALEEHYDVSVAGSADEAFNLMEAQEHDVIVTDLRMPGKSGLKVIDKALALPSKPVVIMMTAYGNIETAVEAMKRGAFDFLTKPVNLEKLEILIQRALKTKTLEVEVKQLHERLDEKFSFEGIVGNSPKLRDVIERVKLVAPSKATILIEGETGSGKELIAQAIHQASPRARAPFVAVHCAALPPTLLESELFGHERGAFTGATERRIGRFEAADGGTLFLDEIGEISPATQVKLLRFLETKAIERIGGMKPIQLDVRLVAATNKNLEQMVKDGHVPRGPVLPAQRGAHHDAAAARARRGRAAAARPLHQAFQRGEQRAAAHDRAGRDAPPAGLRRGRATSASCAISWKTPWCCAAAASSPSLISSRSSAARRRRPERPRPLPRPPAAPMANPLSVEENEKRLLREALIKARGNRTKAAKFMGISRRTLHRKLAQWPELDVIDR